MVLFFSYSINNYFQEEITKKVHQKFYHCSWDSFSMHESSSKCQGSYVRPLFCCFVYKKARNFLTKQRADVRSAIFKILITC